MSPTSDFDISPSTTSSFPTTPVESSPTTPRSSENFFLQQLYGLGNLGPGFSPQISAPSVAKVSRETYSSDANTPNIRCGLFNSTMASQSVYHSASAFERVHESRLPALPSANSIDSNNLSTSDWCQHPFTAEQQEWMQLMPPTAGNKPFGCGDFDFSKACASEKARNGSTFGISNSLQTRQHHGPASSEVRF